MSAVTRRVMPVEIINQSPNKARTLIKLDLFVKPGDR